MKNTHEIERKKGGMGNRFFRTIICLFTCFNVTILLPLSVYAAKATPTIEKLKNSITGVGDIIAGFAAPIFTIVLVIAGIAMMTGAQGRQWAKPTMLFGGIGYVIVSFAATIVNSFTTSFA